MKLEAVTISVGYADFLEHTLPENLNHLDRLVVVTSPEDVATQRLCQKYSVDCIETEAFTEDGQAFNKGKGILQGQMHLRNEEWMIHLDADTLLPHGFRQRLRQASLDPRNIYGADRFNIRGWDQFAKIKESLRPQFQWRYMITPPPEEQNLGARVLHNEFGYCPIGYFQMWNAATKRRYPTIYGSAEHSDLMFSLQWPRERRILLPEFFVYHLESDDAKFGANWEGRRTKHFGPKHHHHHEPCPYKPHHHHHHGERV